MQPKIALAFNDLNVSNLISAETLSAGSVPQVAWGTYGTHSAAYELTTLAG